MIYGENNYSKLVNLAEQKIEIIMGLEDEGRKKFGLYSMLTGFGQEYEIKNYMGIGLVQQISIRCKKNKASRHF